MTTASLHGNMRGMSLSAKPMRGEDLQKHRHPTVVVSAPLPCSTRSTVLASTH